MKYLKKSIIASGVLLVLLFGGLYQYKLRGSSFTDEFALTEVFGNYKSECNCSELKGVSSYFSTAEYQKYGQLTLFDNHKKNTYERQDLNQYEITTTLNLEDGSKLVLIMSKSYHATSGELLDCDGCGSWLSVGIFKKIKSKWVLVDKAINLYSDGAMGKSPEVIVSNKGEQDWFEIVVSHSYSLHGEEDESKVKIVYRDGNWHTINML